MKTISPESVLFIRRDNIGDLVCTTPAIRAVRLKYPKARIAVLVNSYNAGAVSNNPDVDTVFVYEKAKHSTGKRGFRIFLDNLGLILRIRKEKFSAVIGCSYGYSARLARYAFFTGARFKIGFAKKGLPASRFTYNVPVPEPAETVHEVEAMMRLVAPLGVEGQPPGLFIRPSEEELKKARQYLNQPLQCKTVAFIISSRKPRNRWPRERWKELGNRVQEKPGIRILLLWAPGPSNNPMHPGDDENAEWLLTQMGGKKPLAYRTENLGELVAATSLADMVVCSDGGGMHIAAGLGKPILTIWGSTDKRRWAPWGVPHRILQSDTGLASSISAQEAYEAFNKLFYCPPETRPDMPR